MLPRTSMGGVKLFVIDYLQLLHSTSRRAENRQQEIADISNGIKALAKELKAPMIVLRRSIAGWKMTQPQAEAVGLVRSRRD